jgi:hypothetical protein
MPKPFLSLIYFFLSVSVAGQSLCDPFRAIGISNEGKTWHVVFNECKAAQNPFIELDENPAIRARIVHNLGIMKITSLNSTDSLPRVEYFDEEGYTVYIGNKNDTLSSQFYYNVFNKNNLLSSITGKMGYSINGVKNEDSDALHDVEEFKYDDLNRLIERRQITKSYLKSFKCKLGEGSEYTYYKRPHSFTFIEKIKYDHENNVLKTSRSNGNIDVFRYDSGNRIIEASDLGNYANVETWHFFYNDKDKLDSVSVTHRNKSIEGYTIRFFYDDENRLVHFVRCFNQGKLCNDITYCYSNNALVEINDCSYSFEVCTMRQFHYNREGLISKIEYFRWGELTHWEEYFYEFY